MPGVLSATSANTTSAANQPVATTTLPPSVASSSSSPSSSVGATTTTTSSRNTMPNNLPIVTVDSHSVNTSVKRLRQNSHTTLHRILRTACPASSRLSNRLLRYPIFVLSIMVVCFLCFLCFLVAQVVSSSSSFSSTPYSPPSSYASSYAFEFDNRVDDIHVIRQRESEQGITAKSIPEAPELLRPDINTPLVPLRIVLTVPPFESSFVSAQQREQQKKHPYNSQTFSDLVASLSNADYDGHAVNLRILLLPSDDDEATTPSSTALSVSPSVPDSTYTAAKAISWPHGRVTVANASSTGPLEALSIAWGPSRGVADAVALIDAQRAKPLSSQWFRYVTSARMRYAHRADIIAFCVEAVRPRGEDAPLLSSKSATANRTTGADDDSSDPDMDMDSDVFLWQGVDDGGVLIPASVDKWRAFLRWLQQQRPDWFMWPAVIGLRDKRDERWDHFRSTVRATWPLWLSRFSALYDLYTLYPRHAHPEPLSLPHVTSTTTTTSKSDKQHTELLRNARIVRLALDASIVRHGADSRIADGSVHSIVSLGRRHGGVVSLTVINRAFLDTARSWICNVDVAGFRPPGIVWITTDDEAYEGLRHVPDSVAVRMAEMRGAKRGTRFGSPGYWLLMLERTTLIRDILDHGVAVFAFETDQIWLRDPVPYVARALHGGGDDVDIVGTIDSSHDIAGNFLFLNPTLATRRLWAEVVHRFEHAYNAEHMDTQPATARIIIENDQTLLTKLTLFDELFRARAPTVFRALDPELFVSGRWYDGGKRFYTSRKSRSPIIINNNFIEGIARKTLRLKRHAHWFLGLDGSCKAARVRRAIEQNEWRAEQAGMLPALAVSEAGGSSSNSNKLGRVIVGVDEGADLEMAISALSSEREDEQTKLVLQPKTDQEHVVHGSSSSSDTSRLFRPWVRDGAVKWADDAGSWRWPWSWPLSLAAWHRPGTTSSSSGNSNSNGATGGDSRAVVGRGAAKPVAVPAAAAVATTRTGRRTASRQ